MRYFNTAGPVNCEEHYCLPPLERFDLEEIERLIRQQKYFSLCAPRGSGKTTSLLALMDHLRKENRYRCVYFNVELDESAGENVPEAMAAILNEMSRSAEVFLQDEFPGRVWRDILEKSGALSAFVELVTQWAQRQKEKPLLLVIDGFETITGDALFSLLRQIRTGYTYRPTHFPQSIIMCGVHDVRDYGILNAKGKRVTTGGSVFNIKGASLRIDDFSRDQMGRLYAAHTEETGQSFDPDALDLMWEYSKGQPWLANAPAYEACFNRDAGKDHGSPITREMVMTARENLMLHRGPHLDGLAAHLREESVRVVMEPLLTGTVIPGRMDSWDIEYVLDLGLLRKSPHLVVANGFYKEFIPRMLAEAVQGALPFDPDVYAAPDGQLEMERALNDFQAFFREDSADWLEQLDYGEAGPHLLFQAFLGRIINSGGRIEREYGLMRKSADLMVERLHEKGKQKVVIELKILYKSLERTVAEGLEGTADYMDRCGADDGHLIIFDRREDRKWEEKIFRKVEGFAGKRIVVWGM